jgi:proteasome lid subunit RPN8/RPN11
VTVWRVRPLPQADARGRLLVCEGVLERTRSALRASVGTDGRRHEGLVFWAGRRDRDAAVAVMALSPAVASSPGRVVANEKSVSEAARIARANHLGLIAQVHSHPGSDTRHSDGDDQMVLMPFEGMFSLVVGNYGDSSCLPEEGAGLHQFQDGCWVEIRATRPSALIVVPSVWASPQ